MSRPTSPSGFRFSDPRQARVFERLKRLIGEGAAQFFRDACRVLSGKTSLDTASHMAAHGLREVESALRQVLEPFDDGTPLPSKGNDGHVRSIRRVCRGLQVPSDDPLVLAWIALTGKDAIHERAHRDDLKPPRPVNEEFLQWAARVASVLDAVLERAEASYSVVFKALNVLLAKPEPDAGDIKWLEHSVPSTPLTHGYFFDRLEHVGWLKPLAKSELLVRVVPLDRNEEEGTIGFPPWPAKPYVLRMAQSGDLETQQGVLDVLLALPDTDNTRVHADVAEIALALPADLAKQVANYVERGLREPYHLLLPHNVAPLIVLLSGAGHLPEAFSLTKVMFELLPDPTPPKTYGEFTFPPTPRARVQDYFYDQSMKKVVPALIEADPWEAASVFAELLAGAVKYSQADGGDGRHAPSRAWWSSLDATGDDPRDELLRALLGATEIAADDDPARVPELIAMLESHGWLAFTRVALRVLATAENPPVELADRYATDPALFEEPEVLSELMDLVKVRFPTLGPDAQAQVLARLSAEQDPGEVRRQLEQWHDRQVSDEEVAQDIRRTKYASLRPLKDVLPADLRIEFDKWAEEFKAEESPTPPAAGWGDESPKSADELAELTDEGLLSYLREAKFGHEPFGPSLEGLGDSLSEVVSRLPERFSKVANQLQGLDPSLVSGVLRGIEAAAKAKKPVAWEEVLQLCRWVVDQPREIPGRKTRYSDLDPGWVWTRRQIASLVLQSLQDQPNAVDIALRAEVWAIIAILLTDPNPEPEQTRDDDPLSTALNSVRGEAVRAVMAFGLWVRRSDPSKKSFEQMPEVRVALEAHIDPLVDASPAIRAVYGELLSLLYHLDEGWLRANIHQIFPNDAGQEDMWRAAWGTYVRYRVPLVPMLDTLDSSYRKAIDLARTEPDDVKKPESAARHLAEHLMLLSWQGNIPFDDAEGLVQAFFKGSPPALRAHAIEHVGRALENTKGDVPPEVLERIRRLWEWRLGVLRGAPIADSRAELAAFGWWVASKKFEPVWALAQLKEVLALGAEVDWEHQVIETLAELSDGHLSQCLECLDLLLQTEKERWGFELSNAPIRKILEAGIASDDTAAQRLAQSVVNRLISRGQHYFQDLLR